MTREELLTAYAEGRRGFSGADLFGADLYGADLFGADLRGADLRGFRFVGVQHADGWRVKAGCRWFTVPEAIEHWTAKDNKDALRRVRLIAETEED